MIDPFFFATLFIFFAKSFKNSGKTFCNGVFALSDAGLFTIINKATSFFLFVTNANALAVPIPLGESRSA
jgi:hypothetical protein